LGSNSLPECLVFGARAGKAAAEYASRQQDPVGEAILAQAADEQERLNSEFLNKTGGKERIATIRTEMQMTIEKSAGIYREEPLLRKGFNNLLELQQRYLDINLDDHSHTFNTELESALELGFMLDVAESIVNAALHRTESRGAHQRSDFPARDDGKFLAHSLLHRNPDGTSRVEYSPVKITRWPPGERVYGQQAQPQTKTAERMD
jgi:fumarate reductase flavoprotein subunit